MVRRKLRPYLITAAIISLVTFAGVYFSEDAETSRSTLVGGLMGVVIVLAMPIYDIEQWSLLRRSSVHLLVMAVTVLPLVMMGGWVDLTTRSGFVTLIGVFVLSGGIAWTIGFIVDRLRQKTSIDSQ